ncbi:hypothetical protein BDW69DRAFT_188879 [Aspergillus filifer]
MVFRDSNFLLTIEVEGIIRKRSATEGGEDAREDSNLLQRSEDDHEQEQEQEDNNRSDRTSINHGSDSEQQQLAPEAAYKTLMLGKFILCLGCGLVQAMTMNALDVTLPLHLEKVSNYEPLQTGLVFIPLMVPAFFAPIVGYMCDRRNRVIACVGYLILGTMLILL